jgi:hypothetical protein
LAFTIRAQVLRAKGSGIWDEQRVEEPTADKPEASAKEEASKAAEADKDEL